MADLRRVYLDSCSFIDMVKTELGTSLNTDRERDVWFMKKLLEANRDKEIEIYTSVLSIAECQHAGDNNISERVQNAFNRLLMSGQYLKLVQVTPFIAQDARDLRWKHGINLRGRDSVHVASALAMKCEEFLSSNGRFERINKNSGALQRLGLVARNGRETTCLPKKYRQLGFQDAPQVH